MKPHKYSLAVRILPRCILYGVGAITLVVAFVGAYTGRFETRLTADEPKPDPRVALRNSADKSFQAEQWDEAAKAYRKYLKENPDDGLAWFRLGYALHSAGHLDEAVKAHRKAAKHERLKAASLYNLACAHALLGKPKEALKELKAAVDAGFFSANPIDDDPDFRSLLNEPAFKKLAELAKPPAKREVYRQLDFWVGKWDVVNAAGRKVGSNYPTAASASSSSVRSTRARLGPHILTATTFEHRSPKRSRTVWLNYTGHATRAEDDET